MSQKDFRMTIRFTLEEERLIKDLAIKTNENMSEYVRKKFFHSILNIKDDGYKEGINYLLKQNEEINRTLNKVFALLVKLASKDFTKEELKETLESALKLAKRG